MCWSEHEMCQQDELLRGCLPHVYGYFEVENLAGETAGLALVDLVSFTWASFLAQTSVSPLLQESFLQVSGALMSIVETLWAWALRGVPLHGMHGSNLGFIEDKNFQVVLVDWKGNDSMNFDTASSNFLRAVQDFGESMCHRGLRDSAGALPLQLQWLPGTLLLVETWYNCFEGLQAVLHSWIQSFGNDVGEFAVAELRRSLNDFVGSLGFNTSALPSAAPGVYVRLSMEEARPRSREPSGRQAEGS